MEARGVWRIAGDGRKGPASPLERRVLLWGAACLFLVGWSTVAVTNVAETLFLKRVGVEHLPLVFLANSFLLAITTFLVGWRAAREDRRRLLVRTMLLLAGLMLVLWAATHAGVPGALAALVVSAKQVQAIAAIAFWVALGGWLDGRQAKRLFPPIMAGGTAGTLLGSFASAPLGSVVGISSLLLVAAAALAAAAFASARLGRVAPARLDRAPARQRRVRRPPTPASVWRQSGLFRLLATSTLLGGMLAPVLYFQFSAVADAATAGADGEQRLLALFSQFRGWLNVGVLLLQLAGTSWIFQRIGVPLASLVAPVVYLVGFLALGSEATLGAGILAMAAATLQDHSLQEPAERTLGTLFSERLRPTVAAWIEGPVKRTGGVLGNLLVLAALWLAGPQLISWTAAPLALLWVLVVLLLWRIYPSLLLEGARARRVGTEWPLAELLDARTLRGLEAALVDPDPQRCRAACDLLREAGGDASLAAVARALASAPAGNRPRLLEVLTQLLERSAKPRGEASRDALARAVARPDGLDASQRAALIQAYARFAPAEDSEGTAVLAGCRADDAPEVRLAAQIALAGADAGDLIAEAARASDDRLRAVAHTELRTTLLSSSANGTGEAVWQQRLAILASLLESPADAARAAAALAAVAAKHGRRALPAASVFLAQRATDDPRVRAALLRFVGETHLVEEARWAAARLAADSVEESRAASDCLAQLAPDCMDVIVEVARSGTRRQREALRPLLRTLPIAEATLTALMERDLEAARRARARATSLGGAPVSPLVLQRLRERADEALASALSLLAARHGDARLAELGVLLERVRGGRERAVVVEAIDALLPPAEKEQVLPLLDEPPADPRSESGAASGLGVRALPPEVEEALGSALSDDDELTRLFLRESLDRDLLRRLEVKAGLPNVSGREAPRSLAPRPAASEDAPPSDGMLSRVDIVLHLRSLALFERLRTRHLSELAGIVHEESVSAGTTIVREGDFADAMYLIVSGTVHISHAGLRLASLGPRDFFGEMAVLDGELRSATATAATRAHLLRIDRADLLGVMDDHPGIAIAICQTLSRRVRSLNDEVRELRGNRARAAPEKQA